MGIEGFFIEIILYDLNFLYLVLKVSLDYFVRVYGEIYGLFYVLMNCFNNYGLYYFFEKLILFFINNIINNKLLFVYGDGNYICDWFFVEDYVIVIDLVFYEGKNYEIYNIGGFNEWKNIDLVKLLC